MLLAVLCTDYSVRYSQCFCTMYKAGRKTGATGSSRLCDESHAPMSNDSHIFIGATQVSIISHNPGPSARCNLTAKRTRQTLHTWRFHTGHWQSIPQDNPTCNAQHTRSGHPAGAARRRCHIHQKKRLVTCNSRNAHIKYTLRTGGNGVTL